MANGVCKASMTLSLAFKLAAIIMPNEAEASYIGSLAGQWRNGLPTISFPKWSRCIAAARTSKAKASPAVNLSGNDVELADFQGMARRYDSGAALYQNTLLSHLQNVCQKQSLVRCLFHLSYISDCCE